MKRIITLIAIALMSKASFAQTQIFTITFINPLTAEQKSVLGNRMITNFYPNCRPQSISVGTTCNVTFPQPCMNDNTLKSIAEKTLNDAHCPNQVALITDNTISVSNRGKVKNKVRKRKYIQ
jgi:hypothetical protein